MNGYFIDPNVVSEFVRPQPDPRVIGWLNRADQEGLLVASSRSGRFDWVLGICRWVGDVWSWNPGFLLVSLIGLVLTCSRLRGRSRTDGGRLSIGARRGGSVIAVADGLIAATAIEHELVVVTRNVKDFGVCGVPIINPWEI